MVAPRRADQALLYQGDEAGTAQAEVLGGQGYISLPALAG